MRVARVPGTRQATIPVPTRIAANRDEGCRIGAGHTPEEVLEEPCQRERRGDTKADADKKDDEGPPDDESQQAAGAGAEGAADAESP